MLYVYVANVSLTRTSWLHDKKKHSVEAWGSQAQTPRRSQAQTSRRSQAQTHLGTELALQFDMIFVIASFSV
jgi:hypothetical protein